MANPTHADLERQLRRFGHESFRPDQERIIRELLRGRDALAVLATGSGKSLTYQLASQLLPGATVVVAPLLALMKDQVESVEANGVSAGTVNSAQSDTESREQMRDVRMDYTKLLYVSPERFEDNEFMSEIDGVEVSLFVVDEAHCISEWGPDFRPAYLALRGVAEKLGRPPVLALTATATPWIRQDIVEQLGMRDPVVVSGDVDRPNLFLEVIRVEEEAEDYRVLHDLMTGVTDDYPEETAERLREAMQGNGIVYTRTTRAARETAAWLTEWGIAADYYHGQRKKSDRDRVQSAFMAGDLRVIAATNAFGLGVDKPDIRFVVHRDIPASVEAYYQEAGRAGRDGRFARCTLVYRPADLGKAAFLAGSSQLTREKVHRAHDVIVERREVTISELAEITGIGGADLVRLAGYLERDGIARTRGDRLRMLREDFDPRSVSLVAERRRRAYERSRLEMMRGYAELGDCRRAYLLNYFGEEYEAKQCEMCDNDLSQPRHGYVSVEPEPDSASVRYSVGDRIRHETLGEGVVQRVAGGEITVLFDRSGYKTLDVAATAFRQLLRKQSAA